MRRGGGSVTHVYRAQHRGRDGRFALEIGFGGRTHRSLPRAFRRHVRVICAGMKMFPGMRRASGSVTPVCRVQHRDRGGRFDLEIGFGGENLIGSCLACVFLRF